VKGFWQKLFWAAAAFNCAAGLPLFLAPGAMMTAFGVAIPADLTFHRTAGLLIVCFGAVYGMIARDLDRYRPLAVLGVVGKLGVVAIFAPAWASGAIPASAAAVALGDLLFGVMFGVFLLRYRGQSA
jgi:hypothetical protein